MAKGLAVISGSQHVIFKALENGTISMGGSGSWGTSTANVTISGSLAVSGSDGAKLDLSGNSITLTTTGSDGIKIAGGLASAATSSAPSNGEHGIVQDHFVMIDKDTGALSKAEKVDASVVVLDSGMNMQEFSSSMESRIGTSALRIQDNDDDTAVEVNLVAGKLSLDSLDEDRVLVEAVADGADSVQVTFNLPDEVKISKLSASAGVEATGSIQVQGTLSSSGDADIGGTLDVASNASIGGNLTVDGNLEVRGDISQVNVSQKNLVVDDAIILVGSGSAGNDANLELGIVFGSTSRKAFTLLGGEFYLGATDDDTLDTDLDSNNDASGKLNLTEIAASGLVSANTLSVASTATFSDTLNANGNVNIGDGSDDVLTIQSQITASNGMKITSGDLVVADNVDIDGTIDVQGAATLQSTLGVTGATTLGSTLGVTGAATLNSTLDVTGNITAAASASIAGDMNVDGTGSFGGDVTLRAGSNLTIAQGNATLTQGNLTLAAGDLAVTGASNLNGALTVSDGNATVLGGALTVKGQVLLNSSAEITGSLTVKSDANLQGNVTLGDSSSDLIDVKGQFKAPIFDRGQIPPAYISNAAAYEGHMFYLKPDVDGGETLHLSEGDAGYPNFARGNKWYFNEGGEWYSSFFFEE
jgi:cytoskeletal protein CcmA (bactofilin family)